jgi:hypothetical protein
MCQGKDESIKCLGKMKSRMTMSWTYLSVRVEHVDICEGWEPVNHALWVDELI